MTSRETRPASAGVGGVAKSQPNPGGTITSVPFQPQSAEAALERQERQDHTAAP